MRKTLAAAIFQSRLNAERAIHELRDAGVPDSAISVVSLHEGDVTTRDGGGKTTEVHDDHDNKATGALKGLGVGGGLGAIAGLGALFIPGVGPFIAAGALAQTLGVAGSAALVSGAVGATAGGLTGALVDYGISREHAEHYDEQVRGGGVFVAVDTSGSASDYAPIRAILRAAGGESAEAEEPTSSSR
jgi:uncharacterized membrane protein